MTSTTLHVIIAISSIALTTVTYIRPSKQALRGSYIFMILTILSGSYLAWQAPAHMAEVCLMGLSYLAITLVGIIAARFKLAKKLSGATR